MSITLHHSRSSPRAMQRLLPSLRIATLKRTPLSHGVAIARRFALAQTKPWAAVASLRAVRLVGLTASQKFDVVRAFAGADRVGPRLYDALIGQAAIAHDIPCIVTWNTRHMRALFPRSMS